MKNLLLLTVILSFFTTVGYAQSDEARKKIESARIALITERLDLSPEQAERFWPVYREFSQKRMGIRNEIRQLAEGRDLSQLSEDEGKELMGKVMRLRENELDLEKEYSNRLLSVISAQQMIYLQRAEDDFRRMLMQRLERQRQEQIRRQEMRKNRQELLQERNNN